MNTSLLGNVTSSVMPSSIPFQVFSHNLLQFIYQRSHITIIISLCEFLQLGKEVLEGEVSVLHIPESLVPRTMPRT